MIVAMVVDRRPRTLPSASMMNQRGSMSPCLGKYVRMRLLKTTHGKRGARCEQRGSATYSKQTKNRPFLRKGENGNTAEQTESSDSFPRCCSCDRSAPHRVGPHHRRQGSRAPDRGGGLRRAGA